jgi:insulysin
MDRRDQALTLLFVQIFNEPFFDILRTKEQLGYLVRHAVSYVQGVPGLRFSIQSERTPIYLDDRIEAFIEDYAKSFLNGAMTLDGFERHKQALITELLKKNRKMAEEANVYWGEIETQLCDFERARLNAELLRQDITPLDMQLFASRFIWKDASERRKLAVYIWSDAAFNEDPSPAKYGGRHVIRDRVSFLNSCELYPGLPPKN